MVRLTLPLLLLLLATTAAGAAENTPPGFPGEDPVLTRKENAGKPYQETFRAVDLDGDPMTVTAEGLPEGARLRLREPRPWSEEHGPAPKETRARFREVIISWTPTRAQRGAHHVALVVSDGKASERLEIDYQVQEEWESFLLPGVQYVGYFPAAGARYGSFHGAAFELVIGSWVHQTEERGPSHGRVYVDLALLQPDRAGAGQAFSYALGLDLSVERNPWRQWLIPIFGVEVGGFHQRETGTFFSTTPLVGAHLYSSRNIFVTATAGYVFSGRAIDQLGGWRLRAGLNAVLW